MPQRIALRIYWQAVKLLAHGVRYCPHPRDVDNDAYLGLQENTVDTAADRTFKHREWSAPWLTAGEWVWRQVQSSSSGECPFSGAATTEAGTPVRRQSPRLRKKRREAEAAVTRAGEPPTSTAEPSTSRVTSARATNSLGWYDGKSWKTGFSVGFS
mmetsp:Transcript_64072/g.177047  ORF Transcript_64072/g.177047 Transcript_64072/m.177047 type:complete len:156 (-) Transcript_64072:107-574(-)